MIIILAGSIFSRFTLEKMNAPMFYAIPNTYRTESNLHESNQYELNQYESNQQEINQPESNQYE